MRKYILWCVIYISSCYVKLIRNRHCHKYIEFNFPLTYPYIFQPLTEWPLFPIMHCKTRVVSCRTIYFFFIVLFSIWLTVFRLPTTAMPIFNVLFKILISSLFPFVLGEGKKYDEMSIFLQHLYKDVS